MRILAIVTLIFLLAACDQNSQTQQDKETVTIYTHRHYPSDKELYKQFTKETGIEVIVRKGKANELIKKIEIEGEKTEADILITVDVGRLHFAQQKGVLQAVSSETLTKNVPEHLRHKDGYWYALTKRARVIVHHKDRVKPEELSTYEDLASEKWKGKIAIRSSSNVYNQSLLASVIVANGKEKAQSWAKSVVNNMARKPTGNDRDQVKAVAAGKADLAVVNTYYLGKLLNSDNADEVSAGKAVKIFFPNQNDRGTHVNISGAGVTKHTKNKENAMKLIEFLTGKEAQKTFAQVNYEYPIHPEVKPSELVASWGEFKEDKVNLAELGANNKEAVKVFDVVGWK
ncbi:Fe(3+) ABC transporter substrate-binding protein [Candidatus Uabimicrobium amorphum]|uniref:Iron deficiency-induced protein A n=1 Tax=Uabimicrobium amorphum TaxID=2596890 RepID=A0A5S9IL41_UABAM|nr:Fe(3+) ABC transporter substrate-binding protein [Candidatus Uabimicrobium amorphum]BBM83869.1 iron deficiency-induced protein A [Candidatus Uabimicrobium amorphum]